MSTEIRRIAINVGGGFVPGMNTVVTGAALAAQTLGWELVGIRNGFDGLLHPEQHPDGGLVVLDRQTVEHLDPAGGGVLGQSARIDPFHARQVNDDEMVEEVDLSDHHGIHPRDEAAAHVDGDASYFCAHVILLSHFVALEVPSSRMIFSGSMLYTQGAEFFQPFFIRLPSKTLSGSCTLSPSTPSTMV